jgi:glutamyl-tRNA reductase
MAGSEIIAIGINRKIHGYDYVERVKRNWEAVVKRVEEVVGGGKAVGYMVLDTCTRSEIYVTAPSERIESYIPEINRSLASASSTDPKIYRGAELFEHMLRVLSGSESPAPFEIDIVNQVRRSLDRMSQTGYGAKMLYNIFREAMDLSISIRKELRVEGIIGIPELSVMVAKHILGGFDGVKAAVIGTGEVGRRIARSLSAGGVSDVAIVGRSLEKAEDLARLFQMGRAYTLKELISVLASRDLIFLATSSKEPVLGRDSLYGFNGVAIDLGIPRNIDPEGAEALGKGYIWMRDLEEMSHKILPDLRRALEYLDVIIDRYVEKLYSKYMSERIRRDLSGFAKLYDNIRRREIERAVRELHLGERDREILDLVTSSIMKKALGILGELFDGNSLGGGDPVDR